MANLNNNLKKDALVGAKLDVKNVKADLAAKKLNLGRGLNIAAEDHCKTGDDGNTHCKFTTPEHIKVTNSGRADIYTIGGKRTFEFVGRGLAMDDCPDYCKGNWCKFGGTYFKGDYTKDICGSGLRPSDFASVSFSGTLTKEHIKTLSALDCYIGKDRVLVPLKNLDAAKKIMK